MSLIKKSGQSNTAPEQQKSGLEIPHIEEERMVGHKMLQVFTLSWFYGFSNEGGRCGRCFGPNLVHLDDSFLDGIAHMERHVGDPLEVGIGFKHFGQAKLLQDLDQWDFRLKLELWKLKMNLCVSLPVFLNSLFQVKTVQSTL